MADKFWASAEEEGPFTVGPYLTRKDAIGDAPYALDLKDGDYFYVGEEFSIIDRVGVNVDSILDHVGYQDLRTGRRFCAGVAAFQRVL